jgi:hypothetical protein
MTLEEAVHAAEAIVEARLQQKTSQVR